MDTAETTYISSLALIKMLKHARAGVPMEVMGLMLGEFVDEFTVRCDDVFAMPQSGTGASVEAVDPVFQQQMLEMLRQTGRAEMVVGWYHSHPGFGCWLSGVDVNTSQAFEQLNARTVSVVVDPIQSVKGKVVIDAFRTISPQAAMMGAEPRQTTSNVGHLVKPSIQALVHGLNRSYYSIALGYRKSDLEVKMLQNLGARAWSRALSVQGLPAGRARTADALADVAALTGAYAKRVAAEEGKTPAEVAVANVGKMDPRKRLDAAVGGLLNTNLDAMLGVGAALAAF